VYHSELKARTQLNGESLQEFPVAIEQLVYWALVRLPQYFIQTKASYAFDNEIRDWEVKLSLLIGSDRMLDKVLNQVLRLKTSKVAARSPERL
jgi:hypothetical protein